MKRLKRLFRTILCFALAALLVIFAPKALQRFWGDDHARWISERFSETLREKNELVVYEIEITGQETVTQDAWLIGTVQKVEIPYTFSMRFTVDLNQAKVIAQGEGVLVSIPAPEAKYPQLTVDEEKVKKVDWLFPLTPERYAEIKQELEKKLMTDYSQNEEYQKNAWNIAVSNLKALFESVLDQSVLKLECPIEIQMEEIQRAWQAGFSFVTACYSVKHLYKM